MDTKKEAENSLKRKAVIQQTIRCYTDEVKVQNCSNRREVGAILKALPDGLKGELQASKELEREVSRLVSKTGLEPTVKMRRQSTVEELRRALYEVITGSTTSASALEKYGVPVKTLH